MNRKLSLCVVTMALAVGLTLFGGCALFDTEDTADLVDQHGTIERYEGGLFIAVDEAPAALGLGDRPVRFYPLNLPARYEQEGLRVVFSADLVECDDAANCLLAIHLVAIRPDR